MSLYPLICPACSRTICTKQQHGQGHDPQLATLALAGGSSHRIRRVFGG
jgi:hypothetical protein